MTMPETTAQFIGELSPASRARPRVALVNMPWARTDMPSIQCGLLKSELARAGYRADVHYLNLDLAERLGAGTYLKIMGLHGERARLLGEWLFGVAAFDQVLSDEEYFELVNIEDCCAQLGLGRDDLLRLRYTVLPDWIRQCAAAPAWDGYDIVGFTSTFEQNVASMALARRLKERRPGLITIFGGANVDGQMGTAYSPGSTMRSAGRGTSRSRRSWPRSEPARTPPSSRESAAGTRPARSGPTRRSP
jgi:hypothetical protein